MAGTESELKRLIGLGYNRRASAAAREELERLKKRREELEYMAHAHAVEGQELPSIIEQEYAELKISISKIEANLPKEK